MRKKRVRMLRQSCERICSLFKREHDVKEPTEPIIRRQKIIYVDSEGKPNGKTGTAKTIRFSGMPQVFRSFKKMWSRGQLNGESAAAAVMAGYGFRQEPAEG